MYIGSSYRISYRGILWAVCISICIECCLCDLQIISKNMNKKLVIKIDKNRIRPDKSEIFRLTADGKKAKKLLNWKTKMNKKYFENSIKKTIEWYMTSKNQNQINDKIYNI